jgi:hypothetical protein
MTTRMARRIIALVTLAVAGLFLGIGCGTIPGREVAAPPTPALPSTSPTAQPASPTVLTAMPNQVEASASAGATASGSIEDCVRWLQAQAPLGDVWSGAIRRSCTTAPDQVKNWTHCRLSPVHSEPWTGGIAGLENVPWIQAEPASAGLSGHLFFGNQPLHVNGQFPDGRSTKLLWIVDNAQAGTGLSFTAINLTGGGQVSRVLSEPGAGPASPMTQVPSVIDLPEPGCWELTLTSGAIGATVTLLVVD